MNRLIKHIRRWNIWRKHNINSKLHKFFVLIDFIKSPTMMNVLLPEEKEEIDKAFQMNAPEFIKKKFNIPQNILEKEISEVE